MNRFLEQIRQRKLDRIAGAYAVAAWVVVQAASIAIPAFEAPVWLLRGMIIVAILGLPVVLVVAWHRSAPGQPTAAAAPAANPFTRADYLLLSLLVAVLVVSLAQFAVSLRGAPATVAQAPKAAAQQASIAVLPFVNMSGDASREYFSDGISEELLNDLANASDLRVAARTSSFVFKGRNVDVKEIGRLLNVSAVLEGSVREEGNRVRITAQLINAADGYHMWSQTYDRELTGILAVQEEIARDITAALTHRLLGRQPKAGRPDAIDPEAYRNFLEANFQLAQRTDASIDRSIELFREAARLQPDFADGWAGLGMAHAIRAFNSLKAADVPAAEDAVAHARALDPDNVTALLAHQIVSIMKWDWRSAWNDLRRAHAAAPRNAPVLHYQAVFFAAMALTDKAIASARAALVIDPLSFIDRYDVAAYLVDVGRNEEALTAIDQALQLAPANPAVLNLKCRVYAAMQRLDDLRQAAAAVASADPKGESAATADCEFRMARATGDTQGARKILEAGAHYAESGAIGSSDVAFGYLLLGDKDKAMEWFERAYARHEPWMLATPYVMRGGSAILSDPRWKALEQRPEIQEWHATRDEIVRDLGTGG